MVTVTWQFIVFTIIATIAFAVVVTKLLDLYSYSKSQISYLRLFEKSQRITSVLYDINFGKFFTETLKYFPQTDYQASVKKLRDSFVITVKNDKEISYTILIPSTTKVKDAEIRMTVEKDLKAALNIKSFEVIQRETFYEFVSAVLETSKYIWADPKLIFNAGLAKTYIEKTIKVVSGQETNENTIVGIMVGNKIKADTKSYVFLLSALIIYIVISAVAQSPLNLMVVLFITSLIGALHLNQKILEYRINHGLYGSTEYEVREILQFVLSHSDKTDFTNSDGVMKELLPKPEIEERREAYVEGGLYV